MWKSTNPLYVIAATWVALRLVDEGDGALELLDPEVLFTYAAAIYVFATAWHTERRGRELRTRVDSLEDRVGRLSAGTPVSGQS